MEATSSLKIAKASENSEESWLVRPVPGYVCKWKNVKVDGVISEESRKVFVNVCHCEQLPPPMDDLDEEEIAAQFDSGNVTYKIPIVVGELDCVKDNKEENSVKIDILVNSTFYEKRLARRDDTFFRHLLALIFCDLIKSKHQIELDSMSPIVLRNRTSVGDLEIQKIRQKPERQIVEELEEFEKAREKEHMKGMVLIEENDDEMVDIKKEMFGMVDVKGLRIRLFDGKRLEMSMHCQLNGNPFKDPKRIQLKLNPTRCLVIADRRQSLYDFGLPFTIDPSTAKSKFLMDKSSLIVSVEIRV